MAGKWQLARFDDRPHHARNVGFDAHSLWTWRYDLPEEANIRMEPGGRPSRYWGPSIWQNGELLRNTKGKFGPDLFTKFLTDFIKRNRDEPFFAYYSMSLPLWPFVPVPGMDGDRDGVREGPKAQENFTAMVEYLDQLVGRIVNELEQPEGKAKSARKRLERLAEQLLPQYGRGVLKPFGTGAASGFASVLWPPGT